LAQHPTIVQASRLGAREANEDRVGHWSAPGAVLMAVADGLGGHAAGEVASALAIEAIAVAMALARWWNSQQSLRT
jgi:protein phosphatase